MPKLKVLPGHAISPQGAEIQARPGKSICDTLLENHIDIEHACEKQAACTTCHVIIREGAGKRHCFYRLHAKVVRGKSRCEGLCVLAVSIMIASSLGTSVLSTCIDTAGERAKRLEDPSNNNERDLSRPLARES